eukprot:scaffold28063_cov52-Attheya_sp.AAC.4
MMKPSGSFSSSNALLWQSDLEASQQQENSQKEMATRILQEVGNALHKSHEMLDHVEREGNLGRTIQRGCRDLADGLADASRELLPPSSDDHSHMGLLTDDDQNTDPSHGIISSINNGDNGIVSASPDEMNAARSLLHDVEAVLRSIEEDEAEELADVALTVARMMVMVLENIHSSITPDDLLLQDQHNHNNSLQIERLDDDGNKEEEEERNKIRSRGDPLGFEHHNTNKISRPKYGRDRVRLLWPPVVPAIMSAGQRTKDCAMERPLMATALGIMCGPAAFFTTCFVAVPLVVSDTVLQNVYGVLENTVPHMVEATERGAAGACQVVKLQFLGVKLVTRQTLRVARRQVDRRGGIGPTLGEIGGAVVDRLVHPVDTAQQTCDGIAWGWGVFQNTVGQVHNQFTEAFSEADQRTNADENIVF